MFILNPDIERLFGLKKFRVWFSILERSEITGMIEYLIVCEFFEVQKGFSSLNMNTTLVIVNHYNYIMEEYFMEESKTIVETETVAKTESKNNDNIMAALAYVLTFISGAVIYLIEKDKPDKSHFVMFHAMQSIIFGVAVIIVWIPLTIILSIISFLPVIGALITMLVQLGLFVLLLFLIYKAYSGEEYHLPVIGDYAEKYI